MIGEEGYYATTEQVVEVSECRPGSVSQAGSRETIHELVALVHEGRGVGRADRDDLTTMDRSWAKGVARTRVV